MTDLNKLRVAVIATDGFEEAELTEPMKALQEQGANVVILSPHPGEIQGFKHTEKGKKVEVTQLIERVDPTQFDAVLLPGGAVNADMLRNNPNVQSFIRAIDESGKPIAAICHAPWELISAGLVRGRKLTSFFTIQDDVRNAGGEWVDEEVVVDRNWVTSRKPNDIPSFNREMIKLFSRAEQRRSEAA